MCIFTITAGVAAANIMADLALVAAGATVAGGVFSTVSAVQNTKQQAEMADYQAEVESRNAYLARREAEAIDVQGNQERNQLRLQALQKAGEANASYAAAGVALGSGTPADYAADIADAYDLDSRNLNYDIASRKWKTQVQGLASADQARMYRSAAAGYRSNVTPTLLGGVLNTAGSALGAAAAGAQLGSKLDNAGFTSWLDSSWAGRQLASGRAWVGKQLGI